MTVVLFFTGLLAGFELLVRYGLRVPLGELEQRTQIPFRQALILVARWDRLDAVRTAAALVAFLCFLLAAA